MDLSKLSDADLMALKNNDLGNVSFEGLSFLSNQSKAQDRQSRIAAQTEQDRKTYDPTNDMSGMERYVAGFGKAGSDLAMGVRQYLPESLGGVTKEDIEEKRRIDAPLMNTTAGKFGNFSGAVATAAPAAVLPGVNTILGGAAAGSGMALLQPSTSGSETMTNVGLGGLGGGFVPALVTGAKTVKSLIEPFYDAGREKILGRALNESAGGEVNTAIQNLRNATELVPGSAPTVGQAAGVPSLAAMERAAIATTPSATNQLSARQLAQNNARIDALRGATPDKKLAMDVRRDATDALYKAADQETVVLNDSLKSLMSRPSMKSAFSRAEALAKEAGENLDFKAEVAGQSGSMSGKAAHYIKMALDDLSVPSQANGIAGNELKAIKATRDSYLEAIEKQLPAYRDARVKYADLSKPVNQADILAEVEKKATNFRGDITPAAFSRSIDDRVAQSVTGQKNATMQGSLSPQQLDLVKRIQADLLRSDFADTAGRGVGSNTVQNLAYGNMLDAAGIPTSLRNFGHTGAMGNVMQRAGQVAYKDMNDRLTTELAETMLDPKKAAQLMQAAKTNPKLKAMIEALRASGAVVGSAAPSVYQSNVKPKDRN